jgi:serine/threonine-protein kinase
MMCAIHELREESRAFPEPSGAGRSDPSGYRPGQVVEAKYQLVHRMGRGGMGEVWLAHHLTLDAEVALKLAVPGLFVDAGRAQLLHEARVLARVDHPGVVRVLDAGADDASVPFLAMERLRGPSLRQVLTRQGPLSPRAAARILLPVASALSTVHALGIVHRDLKPENVILVAESSGAVVPKLFDFGIAAASGPLGVFPEEGVLAGSPEYMSPEQARGETPPDARIDVWAFALLFCEMISGQSPFAGEPPLQTLARVAWGPAPAVSALPGDATLSRILARGLERDPSRRWSSMQALGEQLATWARRHGVTEDCTGTSLRTHWFHPVLHPLSDPARRTSPSRRGGIGGRRRLAPLREVANIALGAVIPQAHPLDSGDDPSSRAVRPGSGWRRAPA